MQQNGSNAPDPIESASADAPREPDWSPAANDGEDIADLDKIDAAMDGEAARQLIASEFDGFDALVDQVGDTQSIEDAIFESPDWDRATGKRENAIADLIGN